MTHFVDLHAHLYFDVFDNNRESIISDMREKGVVAINVGVDIESSLRALRLNELYPDVFRTVIGQHPLYFYKNEEVWKNMDQSGVDKLIGDFALEMEDILNGTHKDFIVGIGECGLDFKNEDDRPQSTSSWRHVAQVSVFRKQIELAIKYNLPLMLHIRESYDETLTILQEYFKEGDVRYKGNAHFFVGDASHVDRFIKLGFSVSFTGVVTFVKDYANLVSHVDMNSLYLETDSPYVAPVPVRGQQNNPVNVVHIYEKVAKIRGIDLEMLKNDIYMRSKRYWLLP